MANPTDAQTPLSDAAKAYAKKDNIGVPGFTTAEVANSVAATSAAARENDRPGTFAPDAADYIPVGSERTA